MPFFSPSRIGAARSLARGPSTTRQGGPAPAGAGAPGALAAPEPAAGPEQSFERVPAVEVGADAAYVDCPCVDHVGNATWAAVVAPFVDGGALRADGASLPRNYGSSECRAWDRRSGHWGICSRRPPPPYCGEKWCFVDGDRCARPDVKESLHLPGLYFSYATCGNLGFFSEAFDVTGFLPIYLPYMQLSSHGKPVGYSVVSKSSETSNKALRAMLMMGSYVLEVMGVPDKEVWYRELSDESLSLESDEYTTCVHDVALANLDMCIGDWWLTQEASDLEVPFVPVYHEDIKLILRRQPLRDTSFDSALAKFTSGLTRAIEPFEPDLWACILVTMLAASLIMAIVERDHGAPFAVGEAIYLASASFASFGSAYEPRTPGGRVMGLGIAFFLTVVGASFTANTAQFFIQVASSRVEYQSLQEVLDAGKKVCVGAAGLKRALLGKYPTLRELGEEVELQDGEFPNMELHNCYGWVGPKDLVVDAWHSNALDSCEYEFVGHSVHQFFMGYYVTPSLFHPAAYAVSLLRGNGTWSQIHQEVWPNEVTGCTSEAQEGPMRLSAEHMLGPNAFLLLCCLLSLLLHFFCQVARRVRGMASLAAESEGSSSAGSSAGGTPADSAEDT